jgi:sarcosine oxidase
MTGPRPADVIVVGLGAMGTATADELAARGMRVLGLEAFGPGHAHGSSHGPTRIVRRVIEEAPFYVPIALDAFDRWRDLEADSGQRLLVPSGVIRIAPPGSDLHRMFRASADAWGMEYEELGGRAVHERFPALTAPDDYAALFERDAGAILARRALLALQERARRRGAELHFDEPVTSWSADGAGFAVRTADATYRADRLVITAGAWTGRLSDGLDLPLVAHRVVNATFRPLDEAACDPARLPAFIIADDRDGLVGTPALRGDGIYGIPAVAGEGVKIGAGGTPTDPDAVDRTVTAAEVAALREWVARFVPAAAGEVVSTLTCLYTKSPDEHFVIDRHPGHPGVVVASPCSGHGFKYTPAIGALLADLTLGIEPAHDVGPFALDRFRAMRR